MTRCGFPQITLDGTKADWIRLKEKTTTLLNNKVDEQFGTEWGKSLLPLLDRFIGAYDGEIDCLFWDSMIRRESGGSGHADGFCGWFNILFPFMGDTEKNEFCVPYSIEHANIKRRHRRFGPNGGNVDKYPLGQAKAPVIWEYCGEDLKLKYIAGFFGYRQDPDTFEICPNLGWCIAHEADKKSKENDAKNVQTETASSTCWCCCRSRRLEDDPFLNDSNL